MAKKQLTVFVLAGLSVIACKHRSSRQVHTNDPVAVADDAGSDDSIVYESDDLIIKRLSDHIYEHTSFLATNDFGKVDCNGMVVVNEGEAVVFDTPSDKAGSRELIDYLEKDLQCRIKAIIPTHFHEDCVGGMEGFHESGIPAFVGERTMTLLENGGKVFSAPVERFADSIALDVGGELVYARYFGEGHTKDNVVGYFPGDEAVFGGCLIKAAGAAKGNLADANTGEWSETVRRVKRAYPGARIVIPGHGKSGGVELLDYTIALFQ